MRWSRTGSRPRSVIALAEATHRDDVLDEPLESLRLVGDVREDLAPGGVVEAAVVA